LQRVELRLPSCSRTTATASRRQVVARLHGRDEIIEAEVLLEDLGRDEQAEPAAHVTP
jgi:hypothetical protein